MLWQTGLTSERQSQVLTRLDVRDMLLNGVIDSEYAIKVFDVKYKIKSCEMSRSSARPRIVL